MFGHSFDNDQAHEQSPNHYSSSSRIAKLTLAKLTPTSTAPISSKNPSIFYTPTSPPSTLHITTQDLALF